MMFPAYDSPFPPPKTRSELKTANTKSDDDVAPLLTSSQSNSSASTLSLVNKGDGEQERPFSSPMFFPRQRESNGSLCPDWDCNDTRSDLLSSNSQLSLVSTEDDDDSKSIKTITSSTAFFRNVDSNSEVAAASLGTNSTSLDLPFNESMFFPRQHSPSGSLYPEYDPGSRMQTPTAADEDNDSVLGLVDGVYIRPESICGDEVNDGASERDFGDGDLEERSQALPNTPTPSGVSNQAPVKLTPIRAATMLQSSSTPSPNFSVYEMVVLRPVSAKVTFLKTSPGPDRRRQALYVPNSPTPAHSRRATNPTTSGATVQSSNSPSGSAGNGGGVLSPKRWTNSLRRLSLSSPKGTSGRARSVSPGPSGRIAGSPITGTGSPGSIKARTRGRSPAPTARSPLTGQTQFSGTGSPQESPSSPGRIRQALGTVTGSPSSLLRYTRSLRGVPNPPPLMKEPTSPLSAYSVRGAAAMRKGNGDNTNLPSKGMLGLGIQNVAFTSSSISPSSGAAHSRVSGANLRISNVKTQVGGMKKVDYSSTESGLSDQETLLAGTYQRSDSWSEEEEEEEEEEDEGIDEATAEAGKLVREMRARGRK